MKTRLLIIFAIGIIGIIGTMSIFYAYQLPHYSLEIQGMEDTYIVGEEYSFYYTLSGYGNTCGFWVVSYPDQNGEIMQAGEVVDCHRPINKDLSYDSRKDLRKFSSLVPMVEGNYNVTVSLENIESVIFTFSVIGTNPQKVTDSLKIPNAERDAKLAAGYKLYPGVGWVHPDDQGHQQPIYRDDPNNPGELVLDLDAMILSDINQLGLVYQKNGNSEKFEKQMKLMQEKQQETASHYLGITISEIFIKENWNFPFRESSDVKIMDSEWDDPICEIPENIPFHLQKIRQSEMFQIFSEKYSQNPLLIDISDERNNRGMVHYDLVATSDGKLFTASTQFHLDSCNGEIHYQNVLFCKDTKNGKSEYTDNKKMQEDLEKYNIMYGEIPEELQKITDKKENEN